MKWIIGGVLLGVGSAVYSGRVPLAWVVYCFAGLFISMGLALFFAFARNKHYGLLLLGMTYVAAAIVAIVMKEWWPLVAGFAIAWMFRAMGMEPTADDVPKAPTPASTPDSDKNA